jgi:hypothetical protein
MTKARLGYASLALLLAFAGCTGVVTAFIVPAQVWAGQEFEIAVHGTGSPSTLNGATFSCILQVPNGFTVCSSVASTSPLPVRDEPSVLALYTAEPGHYLASFTGYVSVPSASLGVWLQAPATPGGPHTFKVSLLSPGGITDPPGAFDFAAITSPTHSKTLTVISDPVTRFDVARAGLPVVPVHRLACGDLDLDGNDDLLLPSPNGYQSWLSRPGAPWLAHAATGTPPPPSWRVALGDFNGDGLPDCADPAGRLWLGDGAGNWTPGPVVPLTGWAWNNSVGAGDFDGDGLDDVAFGGASLAAYELVQVFRNNGNGTFTPQNNGLPNAFSSVVTGGYELLLTDATGDGVADVVWTPGGGAGVWAGDGQGNWTAATGLPASAYGGIAVGDLTGDGAPELVVAAGSQSSRGLEVFLHLGGNQWAPLPNTGLPAPSSGGYDGDVELLDFDRDGWLDIVESSTVIALWRNLGGGTFALVQSTGLPTVTRNTNLAVGDFDGNAFPDLAATVGGVPMVWLNLGTGLSPYGAPCAAPGFPAPILGGNGPPQRGNAAFAVELRGGLPNGVGLVWLGLSKRFAHGQPVLPLSLAPFGAPGCELLAEDLALHFRAFDAAGFGALPLPIPNDPSLARVTLFSQGATYVPGANPLGALFTGGLALRIE